MSLRGVLKDSQFEWNNPLLWKAVRRKLRTKLRHLLADRFNKVFRLTWQRRLFEPFVSEMNFFHGFEHRVKVVRQIYNNTHTRSRILAQAEKILDHRFKLLGSGEVDLGRRIDWHRDFISGYCWPRKYYHKIELGEFNNTGNRSNTKDVKVPWELSRLQHLTVLGQAYWLTNDEIYTQEFMAEIVSWIDDNPSGIGVNWVCSMDVSLRVVSMIVAYFYFRSSPLLDTAFWVRYNSVLYDSGVHIEQNPEADYWGHGNNHYLTNCAALVWLGLFFGRFDRRTERWLTKGLQNLIGQMDYQVNPDGGSFEGSIAYHRLALEILLYTTILAEKNKHVFPKNYLDRLEKMCEFSRDYLKDGGFAPQFGDADDGRFCILSGYGLDDMRDHRSLMEVAGEYYQRDDFRKAAEGKWLEGLWIFGNYVQPECEVPHSELVSYPETGYYIVRNKDVFFIIRCGRIGQKNIGGHDHNDQLSFELSIRGTDLIIDPGSYVYLRDRTLRHQFRSTEYHNVSQLGRVEQNIIKNESIKDIFTMASSNPGICTFFDYIPDEGIRFTGHITLAGTKIQYERSVELKTSEKRLVITDAFEGDDKPLDTCTCRLHLAKEVKAVYLSETVVELLSKQVRIRLETETPIRVELGMVSPSYGIKEDALVLSWDYKQRTQFCLDYRE